MSNSLLSGTSKAYPASLLLNFDATPFIDGSTYVSTITNISSVSTGTSKFGNYSASFNGTNQRLDIAVGNEFNFGTGDFTAECWFNPSSVNNEAVLFSMADSVDQYGIMVGLLPSESHNNGNGPTLEWLIGNGSWVVQRYGSTLTFSNNTSLNMWHHVAVTRENGILRLYFDGNLQDYIADSTNVTNYNNKFTVGGRSNFSQYFNGLIDSLRVVKGVALYTGSAYVLPNIPSSKNAIVAPKLYNHIVMISTKSTGDITGYVSTSTGYYTVNWWDGTKTTYASGANFAKTSVGGSQFITIYPSSSNGSLDGYFYNVDVSNNNLTSVRAFYSRFTTSPGSNLPGYFTYYRYYPLPYYSYYLYRPGAYNPGAYVPGPPYNLNVSSNSLDSSALNQIYTDLLNGNGSIEVSDNTGVDSDSPSTATNKGYTVYGSLSPNVSALFNFDSNFSDSGGNSVVLTTYGTAAINTTIKKYGAGSAFFDFSGDYAESSSSTFFGFGKDNFTIEFWLYKISDGNYFHGIICIGDYTNGILFRHQTGGDSFYLAGTYYDWNAPSNCPNAQWTHIAIVRENGYFTIYANGSAVLSGYNNVDLGSTQKLTIGASSHNTGEGLNGYIDGLKIVKGKALYTDDFIIPSSAPTTSTTTISSGVTRLLLNCNGSNNSTTFTDSSSAARTVTRTNTVISTTQSKFGGASAYFSNSGTDALAVTNNFNLSNTDYTIEFWLYLISITGWTDAPRVFSIEKSGQSNGLLIDPNTPSPKVVYNQYGTSNAIDPGTSGYISYNTWYHIAISKDYDTYRLFLDGSLIGSEVGPYTPTGSVVLTIGGSRLNYQYNKLNAYIDDFRVITGKALYTANFTPPTSQLTVYP